MQIIEVAKKPFRLLLLLPKGGNIAMFSDKVAHILGNEILEQQFTVTVCRALQ